MDVKALRIRNGLTQSGLADMCGVSLRTVQNWEAGKVIPSSAIKLLSGLNVDCVTDSGEVAGSLVSSRSKAVLDDSNPDYIARLLSIIESRDASLAKSQEQIDRLIAIIEKNHA